MVMGILPVMYLQGYLYDQDICICEHESKFHESGQCKYIIPKYNSACHCVIFTKKNNINSAKKVNSKEILLNVEEQFRGD